MTPNYLRSSARECCRYAGVVALNELLDFFANRPIAVLTGAGLSTDSGIPDYRGAGSPPRTPMNIEQFTTDDWYRRRFWAGARIGATRYAGIEPNEGHRALAALESAGVTNGVITQNVDNLHRRAGSQTVVEVHGNGNVIRCLKCARRYARDEVLAWFDAQNASFLADHAGATIAPDGDADIDDAALGDVQVPVCPNCGGTLRPDVVYFGEHVPPEIFARAEALVDAAEGFLLAGTSLAVNTGIRLVHRAERQGKPLAVINRGPTAIDDRPSVQVRVDGGASESLAQVVARLTQAT